MPSVVADNAAMAEPLGYLLTWTTYGTWMRGDQRRWVDKRRASPGMPFERPEPTRVDLNRQRMKESPVGLDPGERNTVAAAIRETCLYRGWDLHEVSVRSNHVHVVVTASAEPNRVAADLKAYASRAIKRLCPNANRVNWWSEGSSTRYLYSEKSLLAAIEYVRKQDVPH